MTGAGHALPEEDASQDLVLQSATYNASISTTILILKRSLDTGDQDDVAITVSCIRKIIFKKCKLPKSSSILKFNQPGPLLLGWSWSLSDDPNVAHTDAGFATLPLIPA